MRIVHLSTTAVAITVTPTYSNLFTKMCPDSLKRLFSLSDLCPCDSAHRGIWKGDCARLC